MVDRAARPPCLRRFARDPHGATNAAQNRSARLVRLPPSSNLADHKKGRMLFDFIDANRVELITRTRAKVAKRLAPRATERELESGVHR